MADQKESTTMNITIDHDAPAGTDAKDMNPIEPPEPPAPPAPPDLPHHGGLVIDADSEAGNGKVHITLGGKKIDIEGKDGEHVAQVIQKHIDNGDLDSIPETVVAGTLGASLVIFTLFILPIWIILHYRSRAKKIAQLAPPPPPVISNMPELERIAERMERRLDALEALMDAENPSWRK